MGVFTVTIFLHFLQLYLEQQQIATSLICNNKGLVKCISRYSNSGTNHVTTDITEVDIILPAIHFPKQLEYNLRWHRGHTERHKDDRQQWTMQKAENEAVDELAGRVWEEEYNSAKHHLVAPHNRHSMAVHMILLDGSISGNLAHTIPDALPACRGKVNLQEMFKLIYIYW